MEKILPKNIKVDEIYIYCLPSLKEGFIFEYGGKNIERHICINQIRSDGNSSSWVKEDSWAFSSGDIYKATPEQVQWYNVCKQEQKFIPKDQISKYLLKDKFEVGKWYHSSNWSNTIAAKCSGISDTVFYWDEFITSDGVSKSSGSNYICRDIWKEVSLSEIQQYLPENHPDKTTPVPKYVKCVRFWLGKGKSVVDKIYDTSKEPDFSVHDWQEVYYGDNNKTKTYFIPSTEEEYNKQEGINQSTTMFKKNDYIVIITHTVKANSSFPENYCFKVRQNGDSYWDFYPEKDNFGSTSNAWNSKHFNWRYATKEEIDHYNLIGKPYDVNTLKTNSIALEEGEYYTVINYACENSAYRMIGKVIIGNNGDNSNGSLRGKAVFIAEHDKTFNKREWCYKDNRTRDYRKSTPEEIQWLKACISADKYIPEDSLDLNLKPEDLVSGQWYSVFYGGNNWLLKINRIENNKVYTIKYLNINTGYKGTVDNAFWGYTSYLNQLKPANMEEVYQHFPEEKPNLAYSGFLEAYEGSILREFRDKRYFYDSNQPFYPVYKKSKTPKPTVKISIDSEVSIKLPKRKQVTI